MTAPSIAISTYPARPLIDRHRSSSFERGALRRNSPTASPVGSPPGGSSPLQSILKHHNAHPADRSVDSSRSGGLPSPVTGGAGGGGVDASMSNLSLASGSTAVERETPGGSESTRTSLEAPLPGSAGGGGGAHPQTQFRRRVGFDTMSAGEALEDSGKATGGGTGVTYSFTLSAKSSNYCRTRWSRTFLASTDLNEYSVNATDWLLDSFLEDNDEVVVLRVIEPGSSAHISWKASMEEARDEAEGVLEYLMKKNGEDKQISLIVEFAIGPIEETIHRMIEIYKPDSLIVGTRGKPDSLFSTKMGSISRWAVARSPIPVVVVRPGDKVREALARRLEDQKRGRSYVSILSTAEQAAHAAAPPSALLTGVPLERTVTAPEAQKEGGGGAGGKEGSKLGWGFGTKDEGKKKDKGKEFGRFGTIG